MKKKLSSILMISFLAVAGIFGVGSVLVNKQIEETPVVEEARADASTFTGGEIFYLVDKGDRFSDSNLRLWIWDSNNHSMLTEAYNTYTFKYEESKKNYNVYGISIPNYTGSSSGWNNFKILSVNPSYVGTSYPDDSNTYGYTGDLSVSDWSGYKNWWNNGYFTDSKMLNIGKSNTFSETSSSNTPLVIDAYKSSGYVDSCKIAVHYGGYGITSRTVDVDVIGSYIRSVTLPAGVVAFQVLRVAGDLSLPIDGYPSIVYHNNQFNYSNGKNEATITGSYSDGEYPSSYGTCARTVLPAGSQFTLETSAVSGFDWFDGNAITCFYTYCNDFYETYAYFHIMSRIGDSHFVRIYTPIVLVIDGYLLTRNNPSASINYYPVKSATSDFDAGKVWGQSTDINQSVQKTPGALVYLLSSKDGKGHYDWDGSTSGEEYDNHYAQMWGAVFCADVTCSGTGSMTSGSTEWSASKSEYNSLSSSQKTIVQNASGTISGTWLETAVYRYDYIVFYKHYSSSDFDDYLNRSESENRTFSLNNRSPFNIIIGNNSGDITTIIIIAASSVALLSVTALSILVIKKRKQKEE